MALRGTTPPFWIIGNGSGDEPSASADGTSRLVILP